MACVTEVVRALLELALLENGDAAPALTGVVARGMRVDPDIRLTVHFAAACGVVLLPARPSGHG